jgi:hypothetical protein
MMQSHYLPTGLVINEHLLTQTLSGGVYSPTELYEGQTLHMYRRGSRGQLLQSHSFHTGLKLYFGSHKNISKFLRQEY